MIIQTNKPLRERSGYDFYPTPHWLVREVLSRLPHHIAPYILDPGAGGGVWGIEARRIFPDAVIVGTDIRPLSRPKAYDFWYTGNYDFLKNPECAPVFDLVIGNPPYGKIGTADNRLAAELFVRKSLDLMIDGGFLVFLLRLAFLEGLDRAAGLWREYPPKMVYVSSKRPSYTGNGKTDATSYGMFLWQKGYRGLPQIDWIVPALKKPRSVRLPGF